MPGNDIRLLAFDGGGVRGLSSLMILQNLMFTIDPDSPPKPCDYFDMICGHQHRRPGLPETVWRGTARFL
ncbi:hypothetical protein B0J13DRAFT_659949 [Dactylonectria estremocensis]|uniref:PNPLA domain-containing protein n=1 Tax=Dactylonectria estremocensis TaxID=1079267 RepID=A0A9P9I934_9HYPO|nr:hypothetical protein B0J13DRAFT_659949 [Dactylonectria estremocensis]